MIQMDLVNQQILEQSLSFLWRSNPTGFGLEDWRKKCSMMWDTIFDSFLLGDDFLLEGIVLEAVQVNQKKHLPSQKMW